MAARNDRPGEILQRIGSVQPTRRELVKGTAILGAAVTLNPLLSACGGSTGTEASPMASPSPTTGGVLKLGIVGGSAQDTMDCHPAVSVADDIRMPQIWDPLLTYDHNLKLGPALAEEATANATADVWMIRLRPDVTFHNGKTLTAADVVYTWNKVLDPKYPNAYSNYIEDLDLTQTKAIDARTVKAVLKTPNAVFRDTIAQKKAGISRRAGSQRTNSSTAGLDPSSSRCSPQGSGRSRSQTRTTGESVHTSTRCRQSISTT